MEKIKIPKRYKQNLDDRFNSKNAKLDYYDFWVIAIPCKLCRYFAKFTDIGFRCSKCPFALLDGLDHGDGCIQFIEKAIGVKLLFEIDTEEISWSADDNKKACTQLKKLRREAQKLIEWV